MWDASVARCRRRTGERRRRWLASTLSAANAHLGGLDKITGVAKLGVYIATEGDFRDHPKVADGASELLVKVFGVRMLSSRIVLGVASLPLGMPIEIELVFEIAA